MPRWFNRFFGNRGERAAVKFLKRQGFKIVARNFENRYGEIDIIAIEGDTLVFIEVKTRRSTRAGSPLEAVDAKKQQQIMRTAQAYLSQRGLNEQSYRFDVIGLLWPEDAKDPEIQHVRHAFPE
jgi:putative endonuclease